MPAIDEATTRANLLSHARSCGCYEQLVFIFDKYDNMYRSVRTEEERKLVAMELILAIDQLFGRKGPLEVDGILIRES